MIDCSELKCNNLTDEQTAVHYTNITFGIFPQKRKPCISFKLTSFENEISSPGIVQIYVAIEE